MSITITFSNEEARAVEAQLKQIEEDRLNNPNEPSRAVRDHMDTLEATRIRFSMAIKGDYS
jgi:hypothetical protein